MNKFDTPFHPTMAPQILGATLRDWFAGQALAGWLATHSNRTQPTEVSQAAESITDLCYALADAMLAAREVRHDE